MNDEIAAELTDAQKEQLHDVAHLMLKIYRTMSQMRYIDPSWIIEGPHDLAQLLPKCRSLDLDASVIYLYSILPYIEGVDVTDFFQGTEFADFREPSELEQARDPFYGGHEEELMRPWMTPLSRLGNNGTALIYSARSHRIWLLDQALASFDPNIHDGCVVFQYDSEGEEMEPEPKWDGSDLDVDEGANEELSADEIVQCQNMKNNVQLGDGEDFSSSDSDGDGDRPDDDMSSATSVDAASIADGDVDGEGEEMPEDWDDDEEDEDDEEKEGIYDEVDGRPAPDVLRDILTWFRKLKDSPGSYGQWVPEHWHPDISRPLLIKHGWPNDFDGDGFQLDQARLEAVFGARSAVSRQRIEQYKWDMTDRYHDKKTLQARLNAAMTQDHKWLARFQLVMYEQSEQSVMQNMKEAEERCNRQVSEHRRQGPIEGDWPLWELKKMRELLEYERSKVDRLREVMQNGKRENSIKMNAEHDCGPAIGGLEKELAHAQRKLGIYQRAVVVSQLNAERLCPNRTVDELSDPRPAAEADQIAFENELELKRSLGRLCTLEKWVVEIPAEARRTKRKARHELKRLRDKIEGLRRCQQT